MAVRAELAGLWHAIRRCKSPADLMFRFIFKIVLWLFVALLLTGVAAYFYPEKFLTVDSGPVAADVIIVVGGGSHERPLRAAELFRQHAAARVIITGAGDDEINRHLLIRSGVPANAIQVENRSATTWENAEFTSPLLRAEKIHSAILVTSWYHARRTAKTFAAVMPEVKFYSRPAYFGFAREDWKKSGINKRMRLEFLKLPGYWLRYGVNPF
jgi:uncharacterized SAM-binding protein YcdF (DUF218 family)